MRIGIFTECYHPILNGVVVSIDTFKNELEKRGHEFFIFTTSCPNYKEKSTHVKRYACMLPFKPKGGKYPISWPRIAYLEARNIDCFNLDIIHSQHLLGIGHLGLKVGKILKIPTVLTYHTLLAQYTHYVPIVGGVVKRYLIHESRVISNQYDQIITPSPSMKKVLRTYGVRTPIESIPTGVDIAAMNNSYSQAELKKKWQIPEHQKLLLYVSRVAKEKNLDFLFKAIEKLAAKRDDFHLLVVGGGPELDFYRREVKNWGIKPFVTFTDMQPKSETNRIFGGADIFVFPSITETQGIVITEAMAAGIPAVAVGIMGPSDIIRDGVDGFLTPLNVNEFAARINELLDNKVLREKMAKNAQENAKKFSVKATADQLERIYEKTRSNYRT